MKSRTVRGSRGGKAFFTWSIDKKAVLVATDLPEYYNLRYPPAAFLKFTLACLDFLGPEALRKVRDRCDEIGEKT